MQVGFASAYVPTNKTAQSRMAAPVFAGCFDKKRTSSERRFRLTGDAGRSWKERLAMGIFTLGFGYLGVLMGSIGLKAFSAPEKEHQAMLDALTNVSNVKSQLAGKSVKEQLDLLDAGTAYMHERIYAKSPEEFRNLLAEAAVNIFGDSGFFEERGQYAEELFKRFQNIKTTRELQAFNDDLFAELLAARIVKPEAIQSLRDSAEQYAKKVEQSVSDRGPFNKIVPTFYGILILLVALSRVPYILNRK